MDKTCNLCGTALTGRQQRYCSPKCSRKSYLEARKADGRIKEQAQKHRAKREAWNRANRERYQEQRTCLCGQTFMAMKAGTQVHCGRRCRNQFRFGYCKLPPDHVVRILAEANRLLARPLPHVRRRQWVSGTCAWCSEWFTLLDQVGARYCSVRCSRKSREARRGRFVVPAKFRTAIYERDSWTCQLCFEPVDRGAHYLDPWAPTLDHIECQSWALVPDHSEGNLRLAHRWCNAVRSDERKWSPADLVS